MDKVMMKKQREYGIDLLKVFACFLIVAIHTVDCNLGIANRMVQLFTVFAIPMFFLINGYLMFTKREITYKYALKRVGKILLIAFLWEILYTIFNFIMTREIRNFIKSFLLDFIQKGTFFQFWFLGSLIIINLLMPLLRKLLNSNEKAYVALTILLGASCFIIDLAQFIVKVQFYAAVIQTFRLWMWLFYFMAGGCIYYKSEDIKAVFAKKKAWMIAATVISILLSFAWMWTGRQVAFGKLDVAGFYGSLPVIISVVLIFICVKCSKINQKENKIISIISPTIMGIYIVHPLILEYCLHFVPGFKDSTWWMNIAFWLVTTLISFIAGFVINKIPYVRELEKI